MKDKQQHLFLLLVVLMFVGVLSYGMICYRGEDFGLYDSQVHDMNTGWVFEAASGNEIPINIPTRLDVPIDTEYRISTYLPTDFPDGMSIMYRSAQQSVRVLIDDNIIYERGWDTNLYPGDFRGSSWNVILIPQEYVGHKLSFVLLSPYEEYSGAVNQVQYGQKSDLMFYIMRQQAVQLFAAIVMFAIGVGLFLFHGMKAKAGTRSVHITYMALFAVLCSFYLFGESRMMQFFVSNEFLITALPFVSEIMLPIPLLMYVREKWMPQHGWVAVMFQWVFLIDFVVVVTLQMTGLADFLETIITFHVSVVALMIAIITVSGIEIIKYKHRESYVLAQALGVLILGSAAGIWQLYQEPSANVGFSLQIGILGFEIVMEIDSIQNFNRYEEKMRERKYYEKLAYIDALTDGQNRNAYMDRIFKLSKEEKRRDRLYYALYDVNNLKVINDTYGHATGDDAIQRTYRCLVKAFGRKGDCYRIGGDEFAVIMEECREEDFSTAMKLLEHEIELNNREVDYQLSIAGGYAICEPDADVSFELLMKQADQMLYKNKHRMKLSSGV